MSGREIGNRNAIRRLLQENDIFYHLAAIIEVKFNSGQSEEIEMFLTNVLGTISIIKSAEQINSDIRFVFVSSRRASVVESDPEADAWIENVIAEIEGIERRCHIFTGPDNSGKTMRAISEEILNKYSVPKDRSLYDLSKLLGERYLLRIDTL